MTRPRRILMLAPEPVLQPRGTPMSVFHRLRALSALGYTVDLVTYPLGEPVHIPGVRILRVWRPWWVRRIRIGPSLTKLWLDGFVAVTALGCLLRHRYAAIHSHEEAVFIAAVYAALFRLPHLYDMHSSLPQQLENWRRSYPPVVMQVARAMERWAIGRSQVLITICPALADQVRLVAPAKPQVMIENIATFNRPVSPEESEALRRQHGIGGEPLMVYTGNFEPYQGVELLLESFALVHRKMPAARLLIVGGSPSNIASGHAQAAQWGLGGVVIFAGTVPPDAIAGYLAAADALVSPRTSGTNTPLKIYSYLKAGKPIVATDLPTHTQVLHSDVALLAPPNPAAFGEAIYRVLHDGALAARLGEQARRLAERELSDASYQARVSQAYRLLFQGAEPCAESPA